MSQAEEKLTFMEEKVTEPLERRRQLTERQRELVEICGRSSCFRGLNLPLDHDNRFSFIHFATGSLPPQNLEGLKKRIGENMVLFPLGQQKGRQSLVAVTTSLGRSALEGALEQTGFQREVLPANRGVTLDALCEEGEQEQEELTAELERLNNGLDRLSAEFTQPLRMIEALVDIECRLLEAGQKFPRTETAILIAGWVPAHAAPTLEQRIENITGGRYALKTALPDGSAEDQIPVLLRHSWLLRPFETLVSTYGLPSYRELEPTLFVALSYVLMFGMMFGDAGHGLVLALCGLFVLYGRFEEGAGFRPSAALRRFIQHRLRRGLRQLLRHRTLQEICALARSIGGRSHSAHVLRHRVWHCDDQPRPDTERHQPVSTG